MDKALIEKYKAQMMEMSRRAVLPLTEEPPSQQIFEDNAAVHTGKLSVFATTLRGLSGVGGATVTVFTGDVGDRNVIDTDVTDMSGQTKDFILPTESKLLSEKQSENKKPFKTYNIYVRADGYVDQVHLNIPIFEGVTSIQTVKMITVEANNDSETPIVIDETNNFGL